MGQELEQAKETHSAKDEAFEAVQARPAAERRGALSSA